MSEQNPVRDPQVVLSQSGQDTILYHPTRREIYVLNPTASFVWGLCDGEHSAPAIGSCAGRSFEGEPAQMNREVGSVLDEFRNLGLVL